MVGILGSKACLRCLAKSKWGEVLARVGETEARPLGATLLLRAWAMPLTAKASSFRTLSGRFDGFICTVWITCFTAGSAVPPLPTNEITMTILVGDKMDVILIFSAGEDASLQQN
jgi:hypothetical protein